MLSYCLLECVMYLCTFLSVTLLVYICTWMPAVCVFVCTCKCACRSVLLCVCVCVWGWWHCSSLQDKTNTKVANYVILHSLTCHNTNTQRHLPWHVYSVCLRSDIDPEVRKQNESVDVIQSGGMWAERPDVPQSPPHTQKMSLFPVHLADMQIILSELFRCTEFPFCCYK